MIEKTKDFIFKAWLSLSVVLVLISIIYIFSYIFYNGMNIISWEFLTAKPRGLPLGVEGGIFPAIIGSIYLMLIAYVFASILAIATASYRVFYCENKKIDGLINLIIKCMAGTPSIVLGLFGYTFLVVYLKLCRSLLAAGITLGIIIFPYIEVRIEKIFKELSEEILNSSYALGVSKSYTILHLIIPSCKKDIISAITLAGGFAMGATAPIILTGAVLYADVPKSLSAPVMALPLHLYILTGEGISLDMAYGTALVLILILLAVNFLSVILKMGKKGN